MQAMLGDKRETEAISQRMLPEHQVNGFISAVGRARWFLLATVLGSTLVLAHTYVEWNHCEAQRIVLVTLNERRLLKEYRKPVDALTASLVDDLSRFNATTQPDDAEISQLVAAASTLVERRKIINMLNDVKPQNQALWMLPFNVPAGDFLPMASLILTVLSIGLWLSGRAVLLTIRQCNCDTLRDIARMYLLFSLARRRPSVASDEAQKRTQASTFSGWHGADWWAKAPELVALALPSVALAVATRQDWLTTRVLIQAGDSTATIHFRFLIGMCVALMILGSAGMYLAYALDCELYRGCSAEIKPSTVGSEKKREPILSRS